MRLNGKSLFIFNYLQISTLQENLLTHEFMDNKHQRKETTTLPTNETRLK